MEQLFAILFYQVPEGIMTLFAGLGLLGVRDRSPKFWLAGVVYGLMIPIARSIGLPFGIHTIILLFLFILIGSVWLKLRALTAFSAWVFANFFISIGEQLITLPLLRLLNVSPEATLTNPYMHALWGWISIIPLAVVFVLTLTTQLTFIAAPEVTRQPRKVV